MGNKWQDEFERDCGRAILLVLIAALGMLGYCCYLVLKALVDLVNY